MSLFLLMNKPDRGITFGIDGGNALGGAHIPYADGLVSRCCDKEIRVGWMPAELIHTVTMTSVVVFLHLGTDRGRLNRHLLISTLTATSQDKIRQDRNEKH